MKKSFSTLLPYVLIVTGVFVTSSGGAWAQTVPAGNDGAVVIGEHIKTLPYEINGTEGFVRPEMGETIPGVSQGNGCQSCGDSFSDNVVLDQHLYPEVKNVDFFGVDRKACCDEWAGLCSCKSLSYKCNCGGLKANKGHLGLFWLRSKYGAENCDFCNGGCCESGNCSKGCGCSKKRCGLKGCLLNCFKKRGQKKCDCEEGPSRISIFGRSVSASCDKCGCCESGGCDGSCPQDEGCQSCK